MAVACTLDCETDSMGSKRRWAKIKRVVYLVFWLAAIWLFMFQVGPRLEKTAWIQPMAEFIEEHDIAANMYFYTEVEQFSDANLNMDNTMKYMPTATAD